MFAISDTSGRFFAALSAIAISAVFMATAIIPASPAGILA
ncbi:recombination protein F [Erythrobacteraceae bacterium E2-1 Yellow Sea]|nr:recombination protein F [Erythrobacteraceae bacterium E2-1 Yellow Sea]